MKNKTARKPTLQVYRGGNGDWYWRLVAPNGKTVMQGEGYRNKAALLRTTSKYLADHDVTMIGVR